MSFEPPPAIAPVLSAEQVIIKSFESFTQEERAAALAYLSTTYNLRERSPMLGTQDISSYSIANNQSPAELNPQQPATQNAPRNNYPAGPPVSDPGMPNRNTTAPPHLWPTQVGANGQTNNNYYTPELRPREYIQTGINNTATPNIYAAQGYTSGHPFPGQAGSHTHGHPTTGYTERSATNQNYYNNREARNGNYGVSAQTNELGLPVVVHAETPVLHRVSLKFPEPRGFDGSRDQQKVEEFIYQVERYTKFYGLAGPRAVETASGYFKGKATTWWRLYTRHNDTPGDVVSFGELLRDKFIPKTSKRNLKDKMEKLKQYGSVAKFNSEFRDMLLELPDLYMNEEDLIHKYLSKLKGKTRVEVEWKVTNEDNLESVMDLAERYDNIIYSQGTTSFIRPRNNAPINSSSDPMDIDNSQLNKLTDQQREFLINNKGCFKCRKIGHFSKDCKVKFGLNNISTNTDEEREESLEEEYEKLFGESMEYLENSDEATSS